MTLLIAIYKLASKWIPGPFAIATGGRNHAKVRYDRRMVLNALGMWPAASERRAANRTVAGGITP